MENHNLEGYALVDAAAETCTTEAEILQGMLHEKEGTDAPPKRSQQ